MKRAFPWLLLFILFLGFGWLTDTGATKLGIPVFVWLAVNLTVFLWVLGRYVGRPMGEFLQARKDGIQAELREARDKLAESESLRDEVQQRLSKIDAEVEGILKKAEEQAVLDEKRIAEQADEDEARFLKRVEDEIKRREEETRQSLTREAAVLTSEIARGIIEKEINSEDRARVLKRSLDALRSTEGR